MSGSLAGKVALVTGAARGQGRAHAALLAREGADVVAVDIAADRTPRIGAVPYELATAADLAQTARLVESQDRRVLHAPPTCAATSSWPPSLPRR